MSPRRVRRESAATPSRRRGGQVIKTLAIKDFKSLKDVSIELGSVNILVGPNGAGKSNLLEALGILGAAASGRIDDNALLRRGVRPGVPEVYKSAFRPSHKGEKLANAIEIKVSDDALISYRINITNPIGNPGPWWVFQHEDVLIEGKKSIASRGPRGARALGAKLSGLDNRTSVGAVVRGRAPEPVRSLFDALDDYAVFRARHPRAARHCSRQRPPKSGRAVRWSTSRSCRDAPRGSGQGVTESIPR
jgi:energy-coupling factor transporter ATP-binding protein EcfA2